MHRLSLVRLENSLNARYVKKRDVSMSAVDVKMTGPVRVRMATHHLPPRRKDSWSDVHWKFWVSSPQVFSYCIKLWGWANLTQLLSFSAAAIHRFLLSYSSWTNYLDGACVIINRCCWIGLFINRRVRWTIWSTFSFSDLVFARRGRWRLISL